MYFKSWRVRDWLAKWLIIYVLWIYGGRGLLGIPTSVLCIYVISSCGFVYRPSGPRRNNNVIITLKRRRDVDLT